MARTRYAALALGACALASAVVGAGAVAATNASGITGNDTITTFAGNGKVGFSGDGGPATAASLTFSPYGASAMALAVDANGNVYLTDANNQRVRKVTRGGTITTIAGSGVRGYSGDGGPATAARLFNPAAIAVDAQGNVYFGDGGNLVRKVSPGGTITTFAGGAAPVAKNGGDGGPATSAYLAGVRGLAVDGQGNLYISDGYSRVRKVSPGGTITTFAGGGTSSTSNGDGGPATSAVLSIPTGEAVDGRGNVYIGEWNSNRVRKVSPGGTITTFAGGGTRLTDGPAASASLGQPSGVAADAAGNVYIAAGGVRRVDPKGTITTIVAPYGQALGDGGPALSANVGPVGLAVDAPGKNLYIADSQNDRVRKVSATRPAATSPKATDALTTFARSIEADLTRMAGGRAKLKGALGSVSSCSLAPAAAGVQVANVRQGRLRILDLVRELRTPSPQAARIRALLQSALVHSIAADERYRDWLVSSPKRGCRTPSNAYLVAAQREDRLASAAKQRLLAAFNPLARRLHLRTWAADTI